MKNCVFLIVMISILNKTAGQETKIGIVGDFEYGLVSGIGNTDLRTYGLSVSLFKELGFGQVGFGIGYEDHQFQYFGSTAGFDESAFEKLRTVSATVSYEHSLNDKWSLKLNLIPTLSSNFSDGIQGDDFIPNADIGITRIWKAAGKTSKLSLAASYGTVFGMPRWYPSVSFSQKINDHWAYDLGFPRTDLIYNFNERHALSIRGKLFGIYTNNSRTMVFPNLGELTHTKLRFNGTDLGLEHNYGMGNGFTTVTRVGMQRTNNLEVLDNQDSLIHNFEPDGTIYITMGLKYNLN